MYGYGRIMDVDLAAGKIIQRDINPEFARKFVGGMGFSCKILYDEVGADVDPLSPDNIVVFANGPLTGTAAPCSGRTEITTKSPLTGSIGTGNTGGVWGATLKHAGIDVIIIRNQAAEPVYLWIDDGIAEIRDARHLCGKEPQVTSGTLKKELEASSPSRVSVLAIGPAGENLVRYACPVNDDHHVAGRGGIGAVMGIKKLKAIAVRGTGTVNTARPGEFREAVAEARGRLKTAQEATSFPGPRDRRSVEVERGCLPGKNFQTGFLPQWLETHGRDVAIKYITGEEGTCYACPMSCFSRAEVNEGKYAGLKLTRGAAPGVVFDFGAKCAIDSLPAIWKCKELCQHLGIDYASASGVISFAMELFQRGIITTKDTDGLDLGWGNDDAVVQMIEKIAFREGFGDILAEGSRRAAAIIGKGAEHYVMTVKGMEMMEEDPRSARRGWIFGDLTNPRGGDNVKSTHFGADWYNPKWWADEFDIFEDVKQAVYSLPPEEVASTWEGKPVLCKWFEDLYSALNALGVCFFPSGFALAIGPTHLSKLYSACTGQDTSPQGIMKLGERIFTLLKAYTMRQGMTRQDDTWPDRFYTEPLPEGPAKGAVLDRDTMNKLLDEYYILRGWDTESGLPGRERLIQLGLSDVAREVP
ncbi:aldehyde ferredoxin oxidoreductase family protein [Chloroflexota bacterium]